MPKGVYDCSKMPKPALERNGSRKPVTSLVPDTRLDDYDDDREYEQSAATPAPDGLSDPDAIYGVPREIYLADLPRRKARSGVWITLYQELLLRLEKTGPKSALEIPIREGYTKRAYGAIVRLFRDNQGPDYVKIVAQKDPPRLFVWRGPNWRKLD